jgi:hypothetical protein
MSTLGCQHFYSLKKPERMMKQKQMDSLWRWIASKTIK